MSCNHIEPESRSDLSHFTIDLYCVKKLKECILNGLLTDIATNNSCFGANVKLPYTDASWKDQNAVLLEGKTYVFTVVVGKQGRNKTFAQQRVNIQSGNPPQMSIRYEL